MPYILVRLFNYVRQDTNTISTTWARTLIHLQYLSQEICPTSILGQYNHLIKSLIQLHRLSQGTHGIGVRIIVQFNLCHDKQKFA